MSDDESVIPLTAKLRANGLMRRIRELDRQIGDYDVLHDAELDRLKRQREHAVGPLVRRRERARRAIESFAVIAYLTSGEVSHRLPNGNITSRPVLATIAKDDAAVAKWAGSVGVEVEQRPHVGMRDLRAWLDRQVAKGHLQRMVTDLRNEFELVDETDGFRRPIPEGWQGVWFWTTDGAANTDGVEPGDIVGGVTWTTNGTDGTGRNFQIDV